MVTYSVEDKIRFLPYFGDGLNAYNPDKIAYANANKIIINIEKNI